MFAKLSFGFTTANLIYKQFKTINMLQLFKKAKTEQQIVAEIHNEFDTAEDRLLGEADSLLSELNLETEASMQSKAARLSNLGFVNSEPVKWVKENSLVKTKTQAELIRYYKQAYPFQKFLTEGELDRICKKYNLVHAPVSNYIKDVPEKNLFEIENVSTLKNEDSAIDLFTTHRKPYRMSGGGTTFLSPKSKWQRILPKTIKGNYDSTFSLDRHLNDIHKTGIEYLTQSVSVIKESKQGLFICAPKSHFDLKGLKQSSTFSFKSFIIEEPKDPIVFRYVRGGVQVLSKWGLEGQDESLVNEKLN